MTYKIVNRKTGDFEYRQGVAYCFESDHDVSLFGKKQADGQRPSASYRRDQYEVTMVASEGPVHMMRM